MKTTECPELVRRGVHSTGPLTSPTLEAHNFLSRNLAGLKPQQTTNGVGVVTHIIAAVQPSIQLAT